MTADPLLPRQPEGLGTGALLALAVHVALLAALAASVRWHAQVPAPISAELWAALPQVAAPKGLAPTATTPPTAAPAVDKPAPPRPEPRPVEKPPAPPAPKPPDPQIAIEQARKEAALRADRQAEADAARARELKLTQERERKDRQQREVREQQLRDEKAQQQAQLKAQATARELRAAQAEDARLAKLREDNLRRMREQIGAPDASGGKGATGSAARDAAPSAAYSGRLAALIREAIVYTGSTPDNAAAEVEVRAAPGGSIVSRRLLKSSGHPEWDEAVLRAIDRLGSLPADRDGRVPATLIVSHRPRDQEPGRERAMKARSMRSFQAPTQAPSADQPPQQAMAPASIDRVGTITLSRSTSVSAPRPLQVGHAPEGALKEKLLGSRSGKDRSHAWQ